MNYQIEISAIWAQNDNKQSCDSVNEGSDSASPGGLIGLGNAIENLLGNASRALECAKTNSTGNNTFQVDYSYTTDWSGQCKGQYSTCIREYPSWCTVTSTGQQQVFDVSCHREGAGDYKGGLKLESLCLCYIIFFS